MIFIFESFDGQNVFSVNKMVMASEAGSQRAKKPRLGGLAIKKWVLEPSSMPTVSTAVTRREAGTASPTQFEVDLGIIGSSIVFPTIGQPDVKKHRAI